MPRTANGTASGTAAAYPWSGPATLWMISLPATAAASTANPPTDAVTSAARSSSPRWWPSRDSLAKTTVGTNWPPHRHTFANKDASAYAPDRSRGR